MSFKRVLHKKGISWTKTNRSVAGRSMIEMLGVLAVIGVLSIGALAGFQYAMNKHRANETIYDVMLRATNVPMKWDNYANFVDREYDFPELQPLNHNAVGYEVHTYAEPASSAYAYRVEVIGLPHKVCRRIVDLNPTNISLYKAGNTITRSDPNAVVNDCGHSTTNMYFFFEEGWFDSNNSGNGGNNGGSTTPDNPGKDDTKPCSGTDCSSEGCTGPNCCTGTDCDNNGNCVGPNCCIGSDCDSNGNCSGKNCCIGADCSTNGCTGSNCCIGMDCSTNGCTGSNCCIGADCTPNGDCNGTDCCIGTDCDANGNCPDGGNCCQGECCNQNDPCCGKTPPTCGNCEVINDTCSACEPDPDPCCGSENPTCCNNPTNEDCIAYCHHCNGCCINDPCPNGDATDLICCAILSAGTYVDGVCCQSSSDSQSCCEAKNGQWCNSGICCEAGTTCVSGICCATPVVSECSEPCTELSTDENGCPACVSISCPDGQSCNSATGKCEASTITCSSENCDACQNICYTLAEMGCSSAGEYCDRSKGLRCRQERAEYLDDTCGDQVGYECYGLYWDTSIEVWADPHSDYVCSDA